VRRGNGRNGAKESIQDKKGKKRDFSVRGKLTFYKKGIEKYRESLEVDWEDSPF